MQIVFFLRIICWNKTKFPYLCRPETHIRPIFRDGAEIVEEDR